MRSDAPGSAVTFSSLRQNLIVAVLAFAGMSAAFMQTLLIPIQGELPRLLDAPAADTAWVITVTLLTAAISNPIAGRLGDMFGKRRVAIASMSMLAIGSVICAVAPGILTLIVGRALQGVGMAVIPLGISMLRDMVSAQKLGTSIALISATLGVGGALGLPVSALVTENAHWHMLFVLSAFLSVLALALIVIVVPKTYIRAGGRLDLAGAIGLTIGLGGSLLSVSQGNQWGWTSPATLTSLAVGLIAFAIWGWYELRVTDPLVDLRVSVRPVVLITNLASVAMGFAMFACNIAFPQILQLPVTGGGMGLDILSASLLLMPAGLAMLVMSPVAGRIERRFGARPLLVAGAGVISVGYLLCLVLPLDARTITIINTIIGAGIGLGYAAMPVLIMSSVPRTETAAANGLNTLMRSLGITIAAALVGALLAGTAGANQTGSFTQVFAMGLGAALLCTALACLIPVPRTRAG